MAHVDFLKTFVEEAQEGLELWEQAVLRYEQGGSNLEDLSTIFRVAHNLKGSALTIGLETLGHFLHKLEEVLTGLKANRIPKTQDGITFLLDAHSCLEKWVRQLIENPEFTPADAAAFALRTDNLLGSGYAGPPAAIRAPTPAGEQFSGAGELDSSRQAAEQACSAATQQIGVQGVKTGETSSLRVALSRLDDLLNLIGELVVDQSIMQNHRISRTTDSQHALCTISQMGKNIQELQAIAMSLRMMPLDATFRKLQRTARTAAHQLGKKVEVVLEGGEVELDKVIVDRLSEPLIHIVRNAVDHGAELPGERLKAGKPEHATLRIQARQREDEVVLSIEDDGAGLHPRKLIDRAVSLGILPQGAQLKDEESYSLIFEPGFSTKATVTEISGRGVGMDVVATSIRELKGSIDITSGIGRGTTFTFTLPLSLSIIKGLVVGVSGQRYVIPLTQLLETFDTNKVSTETVRGKGQMLNIRGEVVPFLNIARILDQSRIDRKLVASGSSLGVVASCRGRKVGFSVDTILGQQSVVLKSLSRFCAGLPGVLGGAILSDGQPALVLNLTEFGHLWSEKHAATG